MCHLYVKSLTLRLKYDQGGQKLGFITGKQRTVPPADENVCVERRRVQKHKMADPQSATLQELNIQFDPNTSLTSTLATEANNWF